MVPGGHGAIRSLWYVVPGTQRSGRATTKSEVRDRPGRLDNANQSPERLGTAHLRTWTPSQVSQRHASQHHLNR